MAKKVELKDRVTGEVIYPVIRKECILDSEDSNFEINNTSPDILNTVYVNGEQPVFYKTVGDVPVGIYPVTIANSIKIDESSSETLDNYLKTLLNRITELENNSISLSNAIYFDGIIEIDYIKQVACAVVAPDEIVFDLNTGRFIGRSLQGSGLGAEYTYYPCWPNDDVYGTRDNDGIIPKKDTIFIDRSGYGLTQMFIGTGE